MLDFHSINEEIPEFDVLILVKTKEDKIVLAKLSGAGEWEIQPFKDIWQWVRSCYIKSWAYIDSNKTTSAFYHESVDNCPICNNDNWFNEYDSYPVPKDMLRCSQCGYLKSKYQSEFVIVPRDIYSQLVEARKEIVLLKEQLESKKETYRLTRKDVLEIVRDEIKNIHPFTFGYFDSLPLDGQMIPKEAIRLCKGFWIDEMGDIVDKKQVRKLEEHYKKYVNKNG